MKKTKKQAFTLIELLVVIAIIGILATLAVVSLQSARAKARDAKRVADVKQIQTALELHFNEVGYYPATLITPPMPTFMATIPKAPTPADNSTGSVCTDAPVANYTNNYIYVPATAPAGTYTLKFCLGSKTGELDFGVRTASQNGIQ